MVQSPNTKCSAMGVHLSCSFWVVFLRPLWGPVTFVTRLIVMAQGYGYPYEIRLNLRSSHTTIHRAAGWRFRIIYQDTPAPTVTYTTAQVIGTCVTDSNAGTYCPYSQYITIIIVNNVYIGWARCDPSKKKYLVGTLRSTSICGVTPCTCHNIPDNTPSQVRLRFLCPRDTNNKIHTKGANYRLSQIYF
jgi:hypothetical protein